MIYFFKIIPAFFLPIGIVLLLLLSAAFLKKWTLALSCAVLLFLLSIPLTSNYLIRSVEQFQTRRLVSEVGTGDAIVVLSGMLTSAPLAGGGFISEWIDPDRFFAGIELIKASKAPIVIFTGGKMPWTSNKPEGEVLKEYAVQFGVPAGRIILTSIVENTEDEAREVQKYLGSAKKVILVTSAFHMHRAEALFVAHGLEVIPFPVDFKVDASSSLTVLDVLPNASSLKGSEMAMREWYGRAYYLLKQVFASTQ
jgi:uncharacterized SAM-binding protein YcdF (DUF218 family)